MRDDLQYGSIKGNATLRVPIQGLINVGTKAIKELRFLPISEFPESGQTNILYIDTTNSVIYYWDGTQYAELSGIIYAKTTEQWAQTIGLVSKYGAIYIYTDYRQESGVDIPAVKIGDGTTYVSDLPFYSTGVTENDRQRWDNKVSAKISPLDPENLILLTD